MVITSKPPFPRVDWPANMLLRGPAYGAEKGKGVIVLWGWWVIGCGSPANRRNPTEEIRGIHEPE